MVAAPHAEGQEEVRQSDLRSALKLDKSAISRRVADALSGGFLKNLEDRKGRPARLILGDALPDDYQVLPAPEHLTGDGGGLRGCTGDPGGTAASLEEVKRGLSDEPIETPAFTSGSKRVVV